MYLQGPRILWVYPLTPPSRYSVTWYSKPSPSILVQMPSGMRPSIVHLYAMLMAGSPIGAP